MTRIPVLTRLLVGVVVALLGLTVLQAPSASALTRRTVTAKPVASAVNVGKILVFNGTVTRTPRKKLVYLQRKVGTKWYKVTATYTRGGGAWTMFVAAPKAAGSYTYRAFAPRQGALAAAASPGVRIAALRPTTVSIEADETTVDAGAAVTLRGSVKPYALGSPVQIQEKDGNTWSTVVSTTVQAGGAWEKSVFTSADTSYRVVVPRAGFNSSATSSGVAVYTRPAIATTALPDAFQDTAYSFTLTAGGAGGTGGWSAAPLPAGLSLNAETGVISGKPTALGDTQVVVGLFQDGVAATPKTLTLHVGLPPAPVIQTASLPNGKAGAAYGGAQLALVTPVTGTWSATNLPNGLSISASGAISGTPNLLAYLGGSTVTVTFKFKRTGTGQEVTKDIDIVIEGVV